MPNIFKVNLLYKTWHLLLMHIAKKDRFELNIQSGLHFILHCFLSNYWRLSQFLVNLESSLIFRGASEAWRMRCNGSVCSSNRNTHGNVSINGIYGIVCVYRLCCSRGAWYEHKDNGGGWLCSTQKFAFMSNPII